MTAPRRVLGPAPDASMDLLNQILRHPLDPDYAEVAARPTPPASRHWAVALVAVVVGLVLATAALQTSERAPILAGERAELIDRIQTAEARLDAQRAGVSGLEAEIDRLRTAAIAGDTAAGSEQRDIAGLAPRVGEAAVTGPGLVVVVDDAPGGETDQRDRVLDLDLQLLANGLWQAGAEAVAINGHRLSNLTAIRGAGDAITVDYRSLTRPYRVEAIGDPRTLPARFAESGGGRWWHDLRQNRQMAFTVDSLDGADALTLAGDPGMVLRYAERAGS